MNNYVEEYITKETAQKVVKNVFSIHAISNERLPSEKNIDIYMECMKAIKYAPSSDIRENVKGEWIHDEITRNGNTVYTPNAKCSVCDCYVFQESNYCPNCGADMRGEL